MPPRILLVGRNSFLARHTLEVVNRDSVRAISHDAIEAQGLLDGIDRVISFARHPDSGQPGFDLERDDPDLRLARALGDRPVRFVMLSTRKVYAPSEEPLAEDAPLGPVDPYGRHKLALEERLRGLLGERLLILRLGNIFGFELEPGRRTFLAMVLERLKRRGEVRFDMSPFVTRDFLPVERCARILARIISTSAGAAASWPDILNVGSGIPLPTGRLALWIIEGYGSGALVIEQPREHDRFVLDVARLEEHFGRACSIADLRAACLELGRRLRTSG